MWQYVQGNIGTQQIDPFLDNRKTVYEMICDWSDNLDRPPTRADDANNNQRSKHGQAGSEPSERADVCL